MGRRVDCKVLRGREKLFWMAGERKTLPRTLDTRGGGWREVPCGGYGTGSAGRTGHPTVPRSVSRVVKAAEARLGQHDRPIAQGRSDSSNHRKRYAYGAGFRQCRRPPNDATDARRCRGWSSASAPDSGVVSARADRLIRGLRGAFRQWPDAVWANGPGGSGGGERDGAGAVTDVRLRDLAARDTVYGFAAEKRFDGTQPNAGRSVGLQGPHVGQGGRPRGSGTGFDTDAAVGGGGEVSTRPIEGIVLWLEGHGPLDASPTVTTLAT